MKIDKEAWKDVNEYIINDGVINICYPSIRNLWYYTDGINWFCYDEDSKYMASHFKITFPETIDILNKELNIIKYSIRQKKLERILK